VPCNIASFVHTLISVYVLIMLVYAVVSWVPSFRGRWFSYVAMLVDPVLIPVRRIIPPLGGLDLSFLIVIILLQVLDSALLRSCVY
jgi:YggT family protein